MTEWNRLKGPTGIGKLIPETATFETFTDSHVDMVPMGVDHINEIAAHWQSTGHKSVDDAREKIALGEDNLELVTTRYNSSKKHGQYTVFVDEGFESKKQQSVPLDRRIAGRFFLRVDGSPLA